MISLLFLLLCSNPSDGVEVSVASNATIHSYTTPIKLEGATYLKRLKNTSVPVSLLFKVEPFEPTDKLDFHWSLNSMDINVRRIVGEVPPQVSIYTTEVITDKKELNITLHLKDQSLIPGEYTLRLGEFNATGYVSAAPILPTSSKPFRVLEGDKFQLSCKVESYPKPENVSWFFGRINSDESDENGALIAALNNLQPLNLSATNYVLQTSVNGTENDMLIFNYLNIDDNGLFVCRASNDLGEDQSVKVLMIKGRWDAFFPFSMISIEVIVVVTAILLFERCSLRYNLSSGNKQTDVGQASTVGSVKTTGNHRQADGAATNKGDDEDDKDSKIDDIRQRGGAPTSPVSAPSC